MSVEEHHKVGPTKLKESENSKNIKKNRNSSNDTRSFVGVNQEHSKFLCPFVGKEKKLKASSSFVDKGQMNSYSSHLGSFVEKDENYFHTSFGQGIDELEEVEAIEAMIKISQGPFADHVVTEDLEALVPEVIQDPGKSETSPLPQVEEKLDGIDVDKAAVEGPIGVIAVQEDQVEEPKSDKSVDNLELRSSYPEEVDQMITETQRFALASMKEASQQHIEKAKGTHKDSAEDCKEPWKTEYHSEAFNSGIDQRDQIPIWSILTDTLMYVTEKQNNDPQMWYSETSGHRYKKWRAKRQLVRNPNNYPYSQLEQSEDKYMGVDCSLKETYDPEVDISTTYLWSKTTTKTFFDSSEPDQSTSSWFRYGKIPLTEKMTQTGNLDDGTPVRILFDSGATKAMVNKNFYNKSQILQKCPVFKIPTHRIKAANDQIILAKQALKFPITIAGHTIEIIAFLLPFTQDYDFIMGVKSMTELEGILDVRRMEFAFKQRSVPLLIDKDTIIPPGKSGTFEATMEETPPDLHDGYVIAKMKLGREDGQIGTVRLYMSAGTVQLKLNNHSKERAIKFRKGTMLGCVDLRSMGYAHLSQNTIQRLLENKFVFFDERGEEQCLISNLANSEESEETSELVVKPGKLKILSRKERKEQKKKIKDLKEDLYPWLDSDDPRRSMTDIEIFQTYVNLTDSKLTPSEKEKFLKLMMKYREAFSLRDEIGQCPNMEIKLKLNDKAPFFIRPFPITDQEKTLVDKEMKKGVLLGILRKGLSSYSSPIMLIPRKLGGIPRIVTDFRHLNSRLTRLNCTFPLVRDAIQMLGSSKCEVISVIDLRDAYHTLRLHRDSQKYCGITPYYGADTFIYQRLGMGLSVSPAIWQTFINQVLEEIQDRKHYLAIMDDLLIHSRQKDHLDHLKALFKALIKNGLKISPKKCQFFKTELTYMGQIMRIEKKTPCIEPMKSRIEAIQKVEPPTTIKGCRSFCGMVNYLSMYLPNLQRKLIPIYQLTRKGVPYVWSEECQEAFEEIKQDLSKAPTLVMPNNKDPFCLVSDTSFTATGAALYQCQKGQWRLVGYNSKRLPGAARNYSISELELFGLAINIASFKHLLRHTHFTAVIDHSALVYILRSKKEPPTLRLKKLIEVLGGYSFKVQFMKGKDMHVSDFLSRHPGDDRHPQNEIIPISFNVIDVMENQTKLHGIRKILEDEKVLSRLLEMVTVMTRSKGKAPPVYPLRGDHKKPEDQDPPPDPEKEDDLEEDPRKMIRQDQEIEDQVVVPLEEGELPPGEIMEPTQNPMHEKVNEPEQVQQPVEQDEELDDKVKEQVTEKLNEGPRPILIKLIGKIPETNIHEETSDQTHVREPDPIMYREKERMFDHINDEDIIREHIPKQVELDKWLEKLKRKVIHDYDVPISVKELSAEYNESPCFRDIYKYLDKGFIPAAYKGSKLRTLKALAEDYVLIKGVLFKVTYKSKKEGITLRMVIPESLVPVILYQYHDTLSAGHHGIQTTYPTINEKYYINNLMPLLGRYILACHVCQSRRSANECAKAHYARYPIEYNPMTRISADLKWMPLSSNRMHYILVCVCEITGYMIGAPIKDAQAKTIAESLIERVYFIFGAPKTLIIDQDPALSANVMMHIYKRFHIDTKVVSPGNHGSLKTERYIRTLSDIIGKSLTGTGRNWPTYVNAACYSHNIMVSPTIGFSPYEMVFLKKPPSLSHLDLDPFQGTPLTTEAREYLEILRQRFEVIKNVVIHKRTVQQEQQLHREKVLNPEEHVYKVGDLVYLHAPGYGALTLPSRKIRQDYIGPLQVSAIIDKTHLWLTDKNGKLLPFLHTTVHSRNLKPCYLNLGKDKDKVLATVNNTKDLEHELRKFEPP